MPDPVTSDVLAPFDPDGPPLSAEVAVGHAAVAMVYELQLFRADGRAYFPFASGTTRDLIPDRHPVPGDKRRQHGYVVVGAATVGPLADGDPYCVGLHVYQGAVRIASDHREGVADDIAVRVEPAIRLVDRTR